MATARTTTFETVFSKIVSTLKANANAERSKSQTKYMKNICAFHGLTSPEVNSQFKSLQGEILKSIPESLDQTEFATKYLLRSNYSEEKSFGILLLINRVKSLKKNGTDGENIVDEILSSVKTVLDEDKFVTWGTVDSLSSQVLCELIKKRGKSVAEKVSKWSYDKDASLWRLRSSCVTFVKIARHGEYNDSILAQCKHILTGRDDKLSQERFVQLGLGWVLRELSLHDLEAVVTFLKEHYELMSREGLRYAIEKMDGTMRTKLLKYKPGEEEEESEEEEEVAPARKKRKSKN
jgi:3-methyladenine DNA glycosylase AlkD